MKKKKLALLLAVAMTVTSIDSTAMMVNAADFTSEEVQEQSVELTDEPSEAAVETDAETEDGGAFSDSSSEAENVEIAEEPEETGEDTQLDIQEEDSSAEDVFGAEGEISVQADGDSSTGIDEGEGDLGDSNSEVSATEMTLGEVYPVKIVEAGKTVWFKFTPAESGRYEIYSTGNCDTFVEFYGTDPTGTSIDFDDDGKNNHNFSLKRNLEAGETYYYRTKMYSEDVKGIFNVQIVQKKVLSVEATDVLTEGIAGTAFYTYADLTVKSADDMVISTKLFYNDRQVSVDDSEYIGSISVSLTKDGQEYSLGDYLNAGTYTMKFVYKNDGEEEASVESIPYTVTIRDANDITNSPLYKGSLSLNETTEVSTPRKGVAYYSFTAPADGDYYMTNCKSYFSVYRVNSEGTVYYAGQTWTDLKKDDRVYLRFYGGNYSDSDKETVSVTVKPIVDMESMVYVADSDSAIDGLENPTVWENMPGRLILTDKEGGTEEIVPTWDSTLRLASGYNIHNEVYTINADKSETKFERYDEENYEARPFPAGNYKVKFTLYDNNDSKTDITAETTFTVKALDYKSLPELTKDSNAIDASGSYYKWYRFTPWKDGYYHFEWQSAKGNGNSAGFDRKWYRIENGKPVPDDNYGNIEYGNSELIKGTQYVIGIKSATDNPVTLNITKEPVAVEMKNLVYSPNPMTFTAGFDDVRLDKFKGTVVFDNDTTKAVSMGYDDYDNDLSYMLVNSDGDAVDTSNLPAGEYFYKILHNRIQVASILVTVVEPEITADLKADKSGTVKNNGSQMIVSFAPEKSGKYELNFNAGVRSVKLATKDESGTYTQINSWSNDYSESLSSVYATLNAGTTYYFGISADDRYQELQITPKLLAKPVKIETKLLENRDYIERINNFSDVKLETTVTFSDDTTKKVSNNETFDGYKIEYEGCLAGEAEYNRFYYSSLNPGKWNIRPCLVDADSDDDESDIEGTLTRNEITITVNSLNDKMSAFTPLEKDKKTNVKATNQALYTFTADEEGTYVLSSEANIEGTAYIYDAEDEYWYAYDLYEELNLAAEQSCVIKLQSYFDATITVSKKTEEIPDPDPGDKPTGETTKDFELTDGMSEKEITVANAVDVVSATFTPPADGYYRVDIRDISDYEAYVSTSLYCDDNRDTITTTSSDALIWKLENGKKYTYKFELREEETDDYIRGSFKVSFRKIELKTIKNIELVLKDEYQASDCTLFDDLYDFYNTKITYQDGSSKIYERLWGTDEYGNQWDTTHKEDESTSYASKAIKHQISFMYIGTGESEWTDIGQQSINIPALASFDELAVNKEAMPFENGLDKKCYRFTPSETGTYRFDSKMIGTHSLDVDIYTIDGAYNGSENRWQLDKNEMSKTYLEAGKVSCYLQEGQTYVVEVHWYYDEDASASTLQIRKVKTLKSIEVEKKPDQKSVLPGNSDFRRVSLDGMTIKATYTDGSVEKIVYGKTDSQGMTFDIYSTKWINDKICRVMVEMGGYKASFDLEAASWDDVPALTLEKEENIVSTANNVAFRRFVPSESGYYSFSGKNCWIQLYDSGAKKGLTEDRAYLEKDVPYWVYIYVTNPKETATVKVLTGACRWEVIEKVEATCTKDGKVVKECKTHGDTITMIDSARGHEWGAWITIKKPSCADGEQQHVCSDCKTVEKRSIKATKAHSFSAWKVTKNATVLSEGVQQRSCSVCGKTETASIAKLPATIALNVKGTIPLKVKQSFTVKVTMGAGDRVVSWKTSNKKVVSVKNGKIKGLKAGKSATITVQLASGKKASFKVKVQKPAVATKSIKVTNAATGRKQGKKATMKRGQSLKLKAALTPITSLQKVKWSTSNKKIVTVSKSGVIKAKKKGKATITVKSGNKKYNIKITVK